MIIPRLVLLGFFGLVIGRSITRPVALAANGFRDLAEGEADLSKRMDHRGNDEIGLLLKDFNRFMAKLHEIVVQLKGSQGELAGIGEELNRSSLDESSPFNLILGGVNEVKTRSEHQETSVAQASNAVSQIASRSQALLETNEIIASIASQTNLLSMNAAIEAAHAG